MSLSAEVATVLSSMLAENLQAFSGVPRDAALYSIVTSAIQVTNSRVTSRKMFSAFSLPHQADMTNRTKELGSGPYSHPGYSLAVQGMCILSSSKGCSSPSKGYS